MRHRRYNSMPAIRYSAHLKARERICPPSNFFRSLQYFSLHVCGETHRSVCVWTELYVCETTRHSHRTHLISFRLLASQIKWRVSLERFFFVQVLNISHECWRTSIHIHIEVYIPIIFSFFSIYLLFVLKIWPQLRLMFIRTRRKTCSLQFIYSQCFFIRNLSNRKKPIKSHSSWKRMPAKYWLLHLIDAISNFVWCENYWISLFAANWIAC